MYRREYSAKDGKEIMAGDHILIDLTSAATKSEYWKPQYEVFWKAPSFRLKWIGGDKSSDTAHWYFDVPQKSSTEKIAIIYRPSPSPAADPVVKPVTVPDPVGAEWMRERAAEVLSDEYESCDGNNRAQSAIETAIAAIHAITLPTDADRLAQALQLPEIKALVELLERAKSTVAYTYVNWHNSADNALAALAALATHSNDAGSGRVE